MAEIINQEYEQVAVNRLRLHERNARQGDVGAIHESINANGFYGACVVQKSTCKILAGNHRYIAAKESGLSTVPVIWVDVDDDQALRILLADNRTNDLADNDRAKLAELLSELALTDRGLEGTAFDGDALDELINDLTFRPTEHANSVEEEWQDMPEFHQEDKEAFRRLIVNFGSQEDVDGFAELLGEKLTEHTKFIWFPHRERNDFSSLEFKSEP